MMTHFHGDRVFTPPHSVPPGRIIAFVGCMSSGKTDDLAHLMRQTSKHGQMPAIAFYPDRDTRNRNRISSRTGREFPATCVPFDRPERMLERIDDSVRVVGIDEVQFFAESIGRVADELANRGKLVACAGLDLDWRNEIFPSTAAVLGYADEVRRPMLVFCARCGAHATKSQKILGDDVVIEVGGDKHYEPRCRACFKPGVIDPVPMAAASK